MNTAVLFVVFRDPPFVSAIILGPAGWLMLALADLLPTTFGLLMLLRLIVVQPLLEELVFRGLLQGWLREKLHWQWKGVTLANLLASLAFSLAHLLYQPPAWAAAVFIPSLIFGYFRDRHESVLSPIILHAWYNAGFFLLPMLLDA